MQLLGIPAVDTEDRHVVAGKPLSRASIAYKYNSNFLSRSQTSCRVMSAADVPRESPPFRLVYTHTHKQTHTHAHTQIDVYVNKHIFKLLILPVQVITPQGKATRLKKRYKGQVSQIKTLHNRYEEQ